MLFFLHAEPNGRDKQLLDSNCSQKPATTLLFNVFMQMDNSRHGPQTLMPSSLVRLPPPVLRLESKNRCPTGEQAISKPCFRIVSKMSHFVARLFPPPPPFPMATLQLPQNSATNSLQSLSAFYQHQIHARHSPVEDTSSNTTKQSQELEEDEESRDSAP